MNYVTKYNSPLGEMTFGSDGEALIGVWFQDGKYYGETLGQNIEEKDLAIFSQTKLWFDIYFAGNIPDFTPKLKLQGSDFRLAVWKILSEIPYGKTITYGQIAQIIALQKSVNAMSSQAVGGAVGHNPVSIIIPCHRVIGANGSLTGYAGGIKRKIKLLQLENNHDFAN